MKESAFQGQLIKEIKKRFAGSVVLKNDANYLQGFPDLLILWGPRWAALEVKQSTRSRRQPNQAYYVDLLDGMSFAAFICPDNKEHILNEMERALSS